MTIRRKEPRALVERQLALRHAQMSVRRGWAAGIEDMQAWGLAEFDPEPLVLYDLNGEPLFYEFSGRTARGEVGRVKAAASRLIGSGVVSVERGPRRWDPSKAMEMASAAAKKSYPRVEVSAADFVCYSYPKVGVRVKVGKKNAIFDVSDGSEIKRFGIDEMDGATAYSFLDSIGTEHLDGRLRSFDEQDAELEAAESRSPEIFAQGFGAEELTTLKPRFSLESDYTPIPFYSSKVLTYAPRCTPHECFALYAQQTNVYCAVATGQMILDFYRFNYDQTAIATAMGTGAGGTSFAGQETGYKNLSNGCLTAWHDFSADWSEAKLEIDANRPLKSGIPGHARACTGWKRMNISIIGKPPERWLQIHDPWPWNANICSGGAVYWENWNAVNHTNFCYVRHRTTPCS